MSNPLIEKGPICTEILCDFSIEASIHKMFREFYEEIAPEHYKLSIKDRMNFEDTFKIIGEILAKNWENAKLALV